MTCDGKTLNVRASDLRGIDGENDCHSGWGIYCVAIAWLAIDEEGANAVSDRYTKAIRKR